MPPETFSLEIRLAAAAKWYELGRVTQGKAAEIAGLSRAEFIMAISDMKISPFQVSASEVIEEADL